MYIYVTLYVYNIQKIYVVVVVIVEAVPFICVIVSSVFDCGKNFTVVNSKLLFNFAAVKKSFTVNGKNGRMGSWTWDALENLFNYSAWL